MAPRAVPLLLGLLLLVPVGTGQSDEATMGEADTLYVMDGNGWRDGLHFTTYPPESGVAGSEVQFTSELSRALLGLRLEPLPGPWTPMEGSSSASLYLSGLDDMLPIPSGDPADWTDSLGQLHIEVRILGNRTTLLQGKVLFEPQTLQPRAGAIHLDIPLAVVERAEVDRFITVDIEVSGRNKDLTNISPVHLHVGSEAHPSHLRLDGFPYAAYRIWEDEADAEYERNKGILTGSPQPSPPPTTGGNGSDDPEGIPGPGLGLMLGVLLAWAVSAMFVRERAVTRRP